jgi:hypothetical protein
VLLALALALVPRAAGALRELNPRLAGGRGPFVMPALSAASRREGTCPACCAAIALGEPVMPVDTATGSDGAMRTIWLHESCASEGDRAVCKHWERTGSCRYEASCVFAHPAARRGARAAPRPGGPQTTRAAAGGDAGAARSWLQEQEKGKPVRVHVSHIPLSVPLPKVAKVFAQYGSILDDINLKPMKHAGANGPLGWGIVKYCTHAEALVAIDALNGRLRFDPETGDVVGSVYGAEGGTGKRMADMTPQERGQEVETPTQYVCLSPPAPATQALRC